MVDLVTLVTAGLLALLGSAVYVLANHLLASRDQLFSALEHLATGFVAGIVGILVLGYAAPGAISAATALPFLVLGYFSSDIVQLAAAKLQAALPASKPAA